MATSLNTASLDNSLASAQQATRAQKRRSAIRGAFFSEFIDMFDIYLPVVALAPVMFIFQPANLSPGAQAVLASLVFITTLLGRLSLIHI